MALLSDF
jgi:hypothetical protein